MITIKKNPNGDTRTAPKGITFEQVQKANDMHREDVKNVMQEFAKRIAYAGEQHDYTKKSQEALFYRDFVDAQENGANFADGEWYRMHTKTERHHLLADCKEDVNLIDVLEMISDCMCAGLTRSGEVRDIEIDDEILQKAVKNTAELVKSFVTVE